MVRTRISLARILQVTVLLSTVSCSCCQKSDDGPPEPPPQGDAPIASVEILPARVSAAQGAAFTLRVRVRDQWGNVLPDGRAAGVVWTTSGDLAVSNPNGDNTVVTTTSTGSASTADAYVIASVPGVEKRDTSTVRIISKPESDKQDWILSEQTANAQASFAFVSGESTYGENVPRKNSMIAFVRDGELEPFYCVLDPHCGMVTLFSPGHAVVQAPAYWSSSCDVVSFVAAPTYPTGCRQSAPAGPNALPPRWKIPVVVWTLAKKPHIDDQVAADKAYADWVFDQPLLGFDLDIRVNSFAGAHTSITHGLGCRTSENHELSADLSSPPYSVAFGQKQITVVYVDAINPGTGDDIGFTCPYVAGIGTLILVSADAINNSTLAHELGHALGQWHSAERDHPDVPLPRLSGFEPSNLMWSSESDWGTSIRHNLTLGQLFQMNLADFSFLKKSLISGTPGLPCSTDASSNSPCPLLARDQR